MIVQAFKSEQIKANPPSLFRKIEFLEVFQEIVDTYGVPRYQEINPAVFTAISFPFLFGVMFGDIAHGGVLFAIGLFLLFNSAELSKDPMMKSVVRLRFIVTLLGFFAFFCGWIYNDFISLSFGLFGGSCYEVDV